MSLEQKSEILPVHQIECIIDNNSFQWPIQLDLMASNV